MSLVDLTDYYRIERGTIVQLSTSTIPSTTMNIRSTRLNLDILYHLASLMDLRTLQTWRGSTRTAEKIVVKLLNARLCSLLAQYFVDVDGFRGALRLTKSVLSGSSALRLLDMQGDRHWTPNDLDIYSPADHSMRMLWYLSNVEHYTLMDIRTSSYAGDSAGFTQVFQLIKHGRRIDLIQSSRASALHPIPYFWSTHLMNYIGADSFCLAYPEPTIQGRGLLNPVSLLEHRYPHPRTLGVLEKYIARGYDFRLHPTAWAADVSAECDGGAECPRAVRFFGDRYCLVGSLRTARDSLYIPSEPVFHPRTVRWWRGGDACGGRCIHPHFASPRRFPKVGNVRIKDVLRANVLPTHAPGSL